MKKPKRIPFQKNINDISLADIQSALKRVSSSGKQASDSIHCLGAAMQMRLQAMALSIHSVAAELRARHTAE